MSLSISLHEHAQTTQAPLRIGVHDSDQGHARSENASVGPVYAWTDRVR